MSRIFLTQNFASLPSEQLQSELQQTFNDLQDQQNASIDIAARFTRDDPLPQGFKARDVVFDFSGGELKVGIYNGKEVIYVSFGSFTGGITDSQHGNRAGGSLHPLATNLLAGFLSSAFKQLLEKLSGFLGLTTSTALPDIAILQNNGDWSFHNDTLANKLYLGYNLGGTIKTVELI